MLRSTPKICAIIAVSAVVVVTGMRLVSRAESKPMLKAARRDNSETTRAKIERAMSAGPPQIARSATIIDKDTRDIRQFCMQARTSSLCMPGNPKVIGDPPMCADGPSMQWAADFAALKPKPTNAVPGITYMLAGATQRSDSDPYDQTSLGITVGPHWMIMWPFDAKATGLPTTHREAGAYIMWSGSPYAHVHIMGSP